MFIYIDAGVICSLLTSFDLLDYIRSCDIKFILFFLNLVQVWARWFGFYYMAWITEFNKVIIIIIDQVYFVYVMLIN